MANSPSGNLSSSFRVTLSETDEKFVFKSCEGLELELEVEALPEGGRGDSLRAVRGCPKVSKIRFCKGTLSGKNSKSALLSWFTDVLDYSKPLKRQMLTIELLDPQQEPLQTWKVKDAWPCQWCGPLLNQGSRDMAVEILVFAHEGIAW